jgi:hypothetical protein
MDILLLVGVTVVVPVMGGPPERAALGRRIPQHSEEELPEAACLVGPVGEVSVVKARDGEHTNHIEAGGYCHSGPTPADPEDAQTGDVENDEGKDSKPVYPSLKDNACGCRARLRVEPSRNSLQHL